MGLDIVELFMRYEETFGIDIPDRDAEHLVTVGLTFDYIAARVQTKPDDGCLTQRTFYAVRRAIAHLFGHERRAVSPSAPLDRLLPLDRLPEAWQQLSAELGMALPDLCPPAALSKTRDAAIVGTVLAVPAAYYWPWCWLAVAGGVASLYGLGALCDRNKRYLFPGWTVGDLVRLTILSTLPRQHLEGRGPWGRDELWSVFVAIAVDQLDIRPEEIRPEARWVDDLGIG